jgi:hypothetical protein
MPSRISSYAFGQVAPYMASLLFVLHVAATSKHDLIRLHDFFVPIFVSIGLATAVHVAAWILTRNVVKAALISWLAILAFYSFGIILLGTGWAGELEPSPAEGALLLLYGIAGVSLVITVGATSRPLCSLLSYVTMVTVLVTGLNGAQVTRLLVASKQEASQLLPSGISAAHASDHEPDLLLLILDKYSSSRSLREQYAFDNRRFERFLVERGFLVPAEPRTNYVQTFLALAALLNMRYLDSLVSDIGQESQSRAAIYAAVEGNRLTSFLRERGYRFIFLPTAYMATRQNRFADLQLPDPNAIRSEFETVWYRTTAIPTLHRLICTIFDCELPLPYVPETAAMLDWKFEQLGQLAGQERPVFVLAHITLPHEPYLYRADCRHRPPYWPNRDDGADSLEIRAAYVEQVRCLNQKLEVLITRWQTRARTPPIILLQSDHGHGRGGRHVPDLREVSVEQVADRVSVFAAYLVPGAEPAGLPDDVTPINAMRFMLRSVFRADLPPLVDATYWSSYQRPHRMTRVR